MLANHSGVTIVNNSRRLTHIMYGLQAVGYFFVVSFVLQIIGVIIAYVKYDDVKDTGLVSHFDWQIRTFWWSLLWAIIGGLTFAFIIGAFILGINYIWVIYRIVRGWLALADHKPVKPYT